jgi:hypothetical protein
MSARRRESTIRYDSIRARNVAVRYGKSHQAWPYCATRDRRKSRHISLTLVVVGLRQLSSIANLHNRPQAEVAELRKRSLHSAIRIDRIERRRKTLRINSSNLEFNVPRLDAVAKPSHPSVSGSISARSSQTVAGGTFAHTRPSRRQCRLDCRGAKGGRSK